MQTRSGVHLYLAGYRGTGKSSVAARLSRILGLPVFDLDQRIVEKAGKTIAEIFAVEGEHQFREWESQAMEELAKQAPAIISLGGGAVLAEKNRALLKRTGKCVLLSASIETIANRISQDPQSSANRPSLTPLGLIEEIEEVLKNRQAAYQESADIEFDTSHDDPLTIAQRIAMWWNQNQI